MDGLKLVDEINRLFDRMVHDRWSRPSHALVETPALPRGHTQLDVDMPIVGGQLGDVSVSLEGRRLVVRAQRRSAPAGRAAPRAAAREPEQAIERSFILPEDAEVSGIEARFEGDVLHVRVSLRPERA